MKTIFQNNKHPYTFMNVSTSDKKFLFLFLWLLCSLLSTVIYHKINNKTYKTDSVDAAISKGHDRYTMFRCHVNDNASLYFIFPQ